MVCPYCGTHIADNLLVCPACRSDLSMTTRLPRLDQRWCASCGALVPPGADVCPSCGAPVLPVSSRVHTSAANARTHTQQREAERLEREQKSFEEEQTHAMPRIESAVPANPDAYDPLTKHDMFPRARVMLVAAMASLFIVGGTVLYITHPWNASAFDTKARVPADTSMAGFPGKKDSLSQDKEAGSAIQRPVLSADETSYQKLMEVYQQLSAYKGELDKSEQHLKDTGTSGSLDERREGQSSQEDLALRIDNSLKALDNIDVTSGTYVADVAHLKTLGSWLRNWSDDLRKSWKVSTEFDSAEGREAEIFAAINEHSDSSGNNTFRTHFDTNYKLWEPAKPTQ